MAVRSSVPISSHAAPADTLPSFNAAGWLTPREAAAISGKDEKRIRRRCIAYLNGNTRAGLRCVRIGEGRRSWLLVDPHALAIYQWSQRGRKPQRHDYAG